MEAQADIEGKDARKYLFDLSFDNGMNKRPRGPEKPKPTFSQEQVDAARQDGYEAGVQAGQKAMMEDQQQYMNVLLTQIDQKIGHVIEASREEWQRQLLQLQAIALVIMRKIMPAYVAKFGLDEIETIISKVVSEMGREPRLVFRINEAQFDEASARINAIAQKAAYAGKVVILGDDTLGPSDCRIEWADGGIERDLKKLWQDIDRVMEEVQSFETSLMASQNQTTDTETATAAPAPESGETA